MAVIDLARFVREYEEKMLRELIAISRKTKYSSICEFLLYLAKRKIIALETVRAIIRILDRFETIDVLASQFKTFMEKTESREHLEHVLTKLIELESYQRELVRLLTAIATNMDDEVCKKIVDILKEVEQENLNRLDEVIASIRRELGYS